MPTIDTTAALDHFKEVDPLMARLLSDALSASSPIAVPSPKPESEYFRSIVSAIVGQQISTKAADAVRGRVFKAMDDVVTPEAALTVSLKELRACGLSERKATYLHHNAAAWGTLPTDKFPEMDNEAIIAELTKLYGVGRWTVEMFLMFSLARADVFSYGDLGLMQGLYESYSYYPHWRKKVRDTVQAWSPHRTSAALTLWFVKDNGPVLL